MTRSAYQTALRMLSRRDYFRAELAERLEQKGFEREQIQSVLDRCGELGLIDDRRTAARFVELRALPKGWGPRRLEVELRRRGATEELAAEVSRLGEADTTQALKTALRRAEVQAPAGWWRVSERRARMVSSLLARGFEASDAIRAVDQLAAIRETEHDAPDDE
jgi:regulatory protein